MMAKIKTNSCQARARREDLMRFSALSGSKISIEKRRVRMILSNEALKEMSVSEWPSFMGRLQLVQEDVFTNAYSIL